MSKNNLSQLFLAKNAKILFVLDFDGVINTIMDPEDFPEDSDIFRTVNNLKQEVFSKNIFGNQQKRVFHVQFAPELICELNKFFDNDNIQLVWLTAWKEKILSVEKPIGIQTKNKSIVLDYRVEDFDDQIGKPEGLRNFVDSIEDSLRIVWIDDTLFDDSSCKDAIDRFFAGFNICKICPNPNFGITRREIKKISEFVEQDLLENSS